MKTKKKTKKKWNKTSLSSLSRFTLHLSFALLPQRHQEQQQTKELITCSPVETQFLFRVLNPTCFWPCVFLLFFCPKTQHTQERERETEREIGEV
jgi:hypothetical protein